VLFVGVRLVRGDKRRLRGSRGGNLAGGARGAPTLGWALVVMGSRWKYQRSCGPYKTVGARAGVLGR